MANDKMMRDRNQITKDRPKRVPLHEQRNKMTTEQKEGFVRRWVNDVPGRIAKFLQAGYSVVEDKEVAVGDAGVVEQNQALGTGARKYVGRTKADDNTQAVLMEIPKELYDEDQKAKQDMVDESDQVLKRSIRENDFYGSVKQNSTYARKKKV